MDVEGGCCKNNINTIKIFFSSGDYKKGVKNLHLSERQGGGVDPRVRKRCFLTLENPHESERKWGKSPRFEDMFVKSVRLLRLPLRVNSYQLNI